MLSKTEDIGALFWALRQERVDAGGIVPPTIAELAGEGRYEEALAWLTSARGSDFRNKPFRGL